METKCEAMPVWYRKENPIEVRDDISFSAFSSDGEVGIMPESGEADIEVKAEEVAFLFGKSKDELWFMPNSGLFFKVSFDSEEASVATRLYEQPTGVYRNVSLIKDERFNVRVYHDALAMIPLESCDERVHDNDDENAPTPLQNMSDLLQKDTDEEMEVENQVEDFLEQTMPLDDEIQAAVDAEIEKHGGRVFSRFRPGNKRLYSFDFAQIGTRFFTIVYADFEGNWLADEEAFAGDPPLWFSEKDHRVSPICQAKKCRSFFSHELPQIKIESMVVLPKGCIVINDDEMPGCWRKTCGTIVVRTQRINETTIQTLSEYFASQPVGDVEVLKLDVVEMVGLSSRFVMNPDNWVNKD